MIASLADQPAYRHTVGKYQSPSRRKVFSTTRTERERSLFTKVQSAESRAVSKSFETVRSFLNKKSKPYDLESEWIKARESLAKQSIPLTINKWLQTSSLHKSRTLQIARLLNFIAPVVKEIQDVWQARQSYGWDGYSALPIDQSSREDALKFLHQLPINIIQPEVVPEGDGTLALEWQHGDSVFVVSFQGSHKLIYAGDFGDGRRTRGHENLAQNIPQNIVAILETEFGS